MIYALIVAIDAYPIANHRLNGCVNDATAMATYLEDNYPCEQLEIKRLFNEQATKANIIAAFRHFQQAKADDTCLFYYSGHGSQAIAPAAFRHIDPDGKVETLVCYDSRLPNGRDLMDKELSFLIWEATHQHNPHFAAIFDCCHSGTNTRDVNVRARMAETARELPTAKDFYGYTTYATPAAAEATPPRGRHVQLAAARASETAKELRIGQQTRGAFTYNLIALLEQYNGQLTYAELVQHLATKVGNLVEKQTPQIDATVADDKNSYFLGSVPANRPEQYTVNFDTKAGQWIINVGAIHNWPIDRCEHIQLRIEADGKTVRPTVKRVDIMRSELVGMEALDKAKSYNAIVEKVPVEPLKLAFAKGGKPAAEALVVQAAKDLASSYFTITKDTADADYWIHSSEGTFRLTMPGEKRPVFRRLKGLTADNAAIFVNDTQKVAHWHHVRAIGNPRTTIKRAEYDIELLRVEQPGAWLNDDNCAAERVDWRSGEAVYNYDYDRSAEGKKKWLKPAFRMKIKNTGQRDLHFSAVNLQPDFEINNAFLPTELLQPGQEAWLTERLDDGQVFKCIPLKVDDAFIAHGVNEVSVFFKVFISTMQLSTDSFNQEALEMDNPSVKRGAGRDPGDQPAKHDWAVEDVELKVVRPIAEVSVGGGQRGVIGGAVTIEMPQGVQCMASLNTQTEVSRNLTDAEAMQPMAAGWMQMDLGEGMSNKPPVNVLELFQTEGMEQVGVDNPIKLHLSTQMEAGEFVIPVCYDAETGLYYPVGTMGEDGEIRIDDLPAPTTTGTRSLGGSIKIFFQKTIGKYVPGIYVHPQLAIGTLADLDEGESAAAGCKVEYSTDTAQVKAAVAGAKRIVLYIHGIIGDTTEMPKSLKLVQDPATGRTLQEQYDLALTFDYENLNTPIEETAKLLKERLAAVGLAAGHGKVLHIIAHSMGGLVSRWFVEQLDGHQVVTHLYMLGTPNQGSPYGSLYEMVTPLLANAVNGAAFLKPYTLALRFVGKFVDKLFLTLQQMNPGSTFMKALNVGKDPGIPYTIIAGNTQLIPLKTLDQQMALLRKVMARFKERGHYTALDKLLFKAPNDIAVSTEFIQTIPGADQWATPPQVFVAACDHISYFGDEAGLERMRMALLA